jgi:hypothetical protein
MFAGSKVPPSGIEAQNAVTVTDVKNLQEVNGLLKKSPDWSGEGKSRLFNAPLMKLNQAGIPEPYEGPEGEFEGMPIDWLKKYALALSIGVKDLDLDNDGYSNFEEFTSKTDPKDPGSKPDVVVKLRLKGVIRKPFPFKFVGILGDKFVLERTDGKAPEPYRVAKGSVIPDSDDPGFKVVNYQQKIFKKIDPSIIVDGKPKEIEFDVSELTVASEDGKTTVLVWRLSATSDDLYAKIFNILDRKEIDVRQKQKFLVQGNEYEVVRIKQIDTSRGEVVVKKINSTEPPYTIPRF